MRPASLISEHVGCLGYKVQQFLAAHVVYNLIQYFKLVPGFGSGLFFLFHITGEVGNGTAKVISYFLQCCIGGIRAPMLPTVNSCFRKSNF